MDHVHSASCGCKEYLGAEDSDDLLGAIHLEAVECLNGGTGTGKNVFRPYNERFQKNKCVTSRNDDPQLLFIIPFTSQVKLKSICVIAKSETKAPTKMSLYINEKNVNFSLTDSPAMQEFPLPPNLDGKIHNAVKQSKFSAVTELIIFLRNPNEEQIEVSYIQLKGQNTGLKRQVVHTVYELNPNAKKLDMKDVEKNNIQMH